MIPLDPKEGALAASQALYGKAKKLKRSVSTVRLVLGSLCSLPLALSPNASTETMRSAFVLTQVTPLLAEAEDELAYLSEVETQLVCLDGAEAEAGDGGNAIAVLREVEAELADGKYVRLSVRRLLLPASSGFVFAPCPLPRLQLPGGARVAGKRRALR